MRKTYGNFYDTRRVNLQNMLLNLGLAFEGRPHCGLDDSKNIARIVCHLLEDGCPLKENERFDGGAHFTKPGGCADTGDGHPREEGKSIRKKAPSRAKGFAPLAEPAQQDSSTGEKKKKSVKELSGLESDEDVADLLYYFKLQSA